MKYSAMIGMGLCLSCMPAARTFAAELGTNNVLVTYNNNTIAEYTRAGALVQTFTDPTFTYDRPIRDIATSGTKEIYAWNGTFSPAYVGRLNTVTGVWTHLTFTNFSVGNNLTAGGIGVNNRYVFATDEQAGSESPPEAGQGIVRFDFQNGTAQRFATEYGTWDVTVGLDGYLYSLGSTSSPGGNLVRKYNPNTLQLLNTVNVEATVGNDHRAIAVNASGQLYLGGWDGIVHHTDSAGNQLHSANVSGGVSDVEIDAAGFVLITRATGQVYTSDQNLTAPTLLVTVSGYSRNFGAVVQNAVVHLPVGISSFLLE